MSDQADNLRQLVRAQRLWREIALAEQPVDASRTSFPNRPRHDCGIGVNRRFEQRGWGIGLLLVRAARRAFGRGVGYTE